MSQLLPFLYQGGGGNNHDGGGDNELSLSLDPALSFSRKRDCPTSESLADGQNKRFHEFTSDQDPPPETWQEVKSSPPGLPGLDTDEDEIDIGLDLNEEDHVQPVKKRFLSTGLGVVTQQFNASSGVSSSSSSSSTIYHQQLQSHQQQHQQLQTRSSSIPTIILPSTPTRIPKSSSTLFSPASASPLKLSSFTTNLRCSTPNSHTSKAREIIAKAIDEGSIKIDLSNLDLEEIPSEIGDLQKLVRLDDKNFQIFLNHNSIRKVPKELFDIEHLTVLILRGNLLTELPSSIRNLQKLEHLSVAQNNLEYLPCELLDLTNLEIFTYNANDFISPPMHLGNKNIKEKEDRVGNKSPILITVSTDNIKFNSTNLFHTRSLVESCLDKISNHIISNKEINQWNLSPGIEDLVLLGIESNNNGVQCGICEKGIVKGIGYVIEWWSNFKGSQDYLPFRRNLCSFNCYNEWEDMINELT